MLYSVRPIHEFWEMPITDINARTHSITDTDIQYEGHSVAVDLLLMPYSLPPPRYSSTETELAGRICVWATRLYARIKRPSVYTAIVYGSRSRGGVGRHCPQALGQTVVIPPNKRREQNQWGEGGVGVRSRLSGFDILINTAWAHRSRFAGHAVFTCGGYAGQPSCVFTY